MSDDLQIAQKAAEEATAEFELFDKAIAQAIEKNGYELTEEDTEMMGLLEEEMLRANLNLENVKAKLKVE